MRRLALLIIAFAPALALGQTLRTTINETGFSCFLEWKSNDIKFSGTCRYVGEPFAEGQINGRPPYPNEKGQMENDNAFAEYYGVSMDQKSGFRLRIRLLLTDRNDKSRIFEKRGQVITEFATYDTEPNDLFHKGCGSVPPRYQLWEDQYKKCWIHGSPWHTQDPMK